MQSMALLLAGLFLPLFPMSIVFNFVFQRLNTAWLRVILLLVWPLPGLWLIENSSSELVDIIVLWALLTSILYSFRTVVIKELSVWTGFIATSAWSLLWVVEYLGADLEDLLMHAFAFSMPLVLFAILVARLERQYESAYVGVVTGLAQEQPRMTGLFVVVMLAVIGSPLFPSFFSLLSNINNVVMVIPSIALAIVLVWLLWSWSGIRLLQELVVGDPAVIQYEDISEGVTMLFFISFVLLVAGGLYMSEVLL
jgi:hypothetical protein